MSEWSWWAVLLVCFMVVDFRMWNSLGDLSSADSDILCNVKLQGGAICKNKGPRMRPLLNPATHFVDVPHPRALWDKHYYEHKALTEISKCTWSTPLKSKIHLAMAEGSYTRGTSCSEMLVCTNQSGEAVALCWQRPSEGVTSMHAPPWLWLQMVPLFW
jgi:hypothetical protein